MKKILFIFHDTNMTGSSKTLLRIIDNLIIENKYKICISFASRNGPIIDLFKRDNVEIYLLNKHSTGGVLKKILARIWHFIKFPFFLYKIKPELVYSNTLMNIGEVIFAKLMGIHTIVHSHEGKNIIQKYLFFIKIEDFFVSEYIVVSEYALKSLNMLINTNKQKHLVYNGIKVADKKRSPFPLNSSIQLSVIATIDRNKAQLVAIKALEYLLNSMSCQIKLNLFGKIVDTQYYKELQAYIRTHNLLKFVIFHGEMSDQSLMYSQTDILLITSYDETFSLTALEACNSSIPVIASNVGGLPEVIQNNVSGLLFKVNNSEELSQQIIRIINDNVFREKMIDQAHIRVSEKFNIDLIANKVRFILDNAMASIANYNS